MFSIKQAIVWLIDNEDNMNILEADYVAAEVNGFSVTQMFVCDCFNLTQEQLCKKLKSEYIVRTLG